MEPLTEDRGATDLASSRAAREDFSSFHVHIPLLAPLVAALGGWLLVKGLNWWRMETWTLIRKPDGSTASAAPRTVATSRRG